MREQRGSDHAAEEPPLTPENLAWLETHGWRRPEETPGAGSSGSDPSTSSEFRPFLALACPPWHTVYTVWSAPTSSLLVTGAWHWARGPPPCSDIRDRHSLHRRSSHGRRGDGDLPLAGDLPTLPLFDPGTSIANGHRILADAMATAKREEQTPPAGAVQPSSFAFNKSREENSRPRIHRNV